MNNKKIGKYAVKNFRHSTILIISFSQRFIHPLFFAQTVSFLFASLVQVFIFQFVRFHRNSNQIAMQNELQKLSFWTEVYKNIYITYNSFCILIGAVIIMVGSKYSVEMFSVCFTCRYAHYNLIIFTTFSKDPFTTTSRLCIGTRSCLLYYCSHIF